MPRLVACSRCGNEGTRDKLYRFDYEYYPLDGDTRSHILLLRNMKRGKGVKHLCYSCLNNLGQFVNTPLEIPKPKEH